MRPAWSHRECGCAAVHRNGPTGPDMERAAIERQFAGVIAAYDECIGKVENNIPWYEHLGGPLVVGADAYVRRQETTTARNDRKNLIARWAVAKTDAERREVLTLAKRWYEATKFGLNGCKGIVPPLGDAVVAQVQTVAETVGATVKEAGSFIRTHVGVVLVAALGAGALLMLRK